MTQLEIRESRVEDENDRLGGKSHDDCVNRGT